MDGIFITGTDTDIGKTHTALGLIKTARGLGMRVAAMKPFETGCTGRGRNLLPEDSGKLMRACGIPRLGTINQYRFRAPASPYTAARLEKRRINLNVVFDQYRTLQKNYDLVVVEGAGGLLVPVTRTFSYANLARDLDLQTVIVAANKLGVINQALLTVDYALRHGIRLLGVVLNDRTGKSDGTKKTNPHDLSLLLGKTYLGTTAYNNYTRDIALYRKILRLAGC